ncbi:MAG: hypothetical protein HOP02_04620, partial [Methylococcaceae bacterium]|nr:hypothetical protein [Methylococcaceae bacterium]
MDIKTPLILQPLAIGSVKHQLPINPVSAVAPVTMINSQKFDQQQWLNAILRQLLPQQTSPTLLLAHILKNLPALQHQEHFSADLKMLLQALIQSLPQISSLNNPQLLTHAVQNAGLFLEAHLAQSLLGVATQLPQDFKANLLKLKAALQLQLLP